MEAIERIIWLGIGLLFGFLLGLAASQNHVGDECAAKGGEMVKTQSGMVCAKLEYVK